MPDQSSRIRGQAGLALVQQAQRRQQQFPDHTSYVNYRAGIAYVQSRRRGAPTPTGPTAPRAPAALIAAPGNGQLLVSFSPGSDGGSPITNYQYSTDGGSTYTAFSPATGAVSSVRITGLNNGTTYGIRLKAVNAVGVSPPSTTTEGTPTEISFWIDPSNPASYSGTGRSVNNIGAINISGGGTIIDNSGGGIGSGTVLFNSTEAGGVFDFNGGFIGFPSFNLGQQFTVVSWVKPRQNFGFNTLLANEVASPLTPEGLALGWNNLTAENIQMFFTGKNATVSTGIAATIENTVWQQIAYTVDTSSNTISFYENGVPLGPTNQTITSGINTYTSKGITVGSSVDGSLIMQGLVGDVRVYPGKLGEAELTNLYNLTKARYEGSIGP